jgi:hypothetical protein
MSLCRGRKRRREIRAIADCKDHGVGRSQIFVYENAVIDLEPGFTGELSIGNNPDADEDEISRQVQSVCRNDSRDPTSCAEYPGYCSAE